MPQPGHVDDVVAPASTTLGSYLLGGGLYGRLSGVAPTEASSGQTVRHRLSRHGDHQLNRALHTVVLTRLRCDDATKAYMERQRAEGKSAREIKRRLKRYVARELYRLPERPQLALDAT